MPTEPNQSKSLGLASDLPVLQLFAGSHVSRSFMQYQRFQHEHKSCCLSAHAVDLDCAAAAQVNIAHLQWMG